MVNSTIALGVTLATLVGFAGLGIWYTRGRINSTEDLISARNSAGTPRTTATLVASVMGVWVLFSAPEAGASFGLAAVIGYAVGEAVPMYVYSKLGPRIRELIPNGHSLTEYAHARYGTVMYAFVLLVSGLYMFIFLAAELTGIAAALSLVAGVPQWQTAVLVGGVVLIYTSYGGLSASMFTDTVQAVLVVPLLVIALAGTVIALGGPGPVFSGITSSSPELLDLGFVAGLQFGLALAFAILGAELLNQTWWQRIYASKSSETVRLGFRNATVANGVIVFVTAFFGIIAVGNAAVVTDITSVGYNADVAFFVLLQSVFPEWLVLVVVLLALLLVMSSVDTLFTALSSLVTADLARIAPQPSDRHLLIGARLLTIFVALGAIYVSLSAQSVLRLFFLADLLGTAVAFPLIYGLYSRHITGLGALVSSLSGLSVGIAYFPDFRASITGLPFVGDLLPAADPLYLTSFAGAFVVSTAVALTTARLSSTEFELEGLASKIRRLDDSAP